MGGGVKVCRDKVQEMKGWCVHSCRQDGSFILVKAAQRARRCVTFKFKQQIKKKKRCQHVFGASVWFVSTLKGLLCDLLQHKAADRYIFRCRVLRPKLLCYFPKQIYVTDITLCNSHAYRNTSSCLVTHPPTHTNACVCAHVHAPCFASRLPSPSCEDSLCQW